MLPFLRHYFRCLTFLSVMLSPRAQLLRFIVNESRHGPEEVDGIVPRAVDMQLRVLHQAFGEGVGFVFDLGRRLLRLHGRGLWGDISHFGHGLVHHGRTAEQEDRR